MGTRRQAGPGLLAMLAAVAAGTALAQENGHPKENTLKEILGDPCVEVNENGR